MTLPTLLPSPLGKTTDELLSILLHEEYGTLPAFPHTVTATVTKEEKNFCAGKAVFYHMMLHCKAEWGEFSFPFRYVCPKTGGSPVPAFLHINFRPDVPDRYQPTEEIVDEGFAVVSFCYKDVTSDDGDFENGLAGVVYQDGKRSETDCGKIGLWAWAAVALMDYLTTCPEIDKTRVSVIGHSRLGKTALLVGALDDRFFSAISNDSGCSGAALSRGKVGESIRKITDRFPYWFCERYLRYADREEDQPFDQHFLLAANAAHRVYVASAKNDLWADPKSEFLSCVAASEYFERMGKTGLIAPDRFPEIGEAFHGGNIGYHLRAGEHYLSREDWKHYFAFLKK